jgi:hypothetical protein
MVEPGTPMACGYCGTSSAVEHLTLPPGIGARTIVRCPRCTVVVDSDVSVGPIWLRGADTVVAGRSIRYRLEFDRSTADGWHHLSGGLLIQRFPDAPDETVLTRSLHAPVDGEELEWNVPPDLFPGVHFLVAPLVVDGAVITVRRPIRVVRDEY